MNEYCKLLTEYLGGETPIIICIGTDLVSGDCLGPMVGRMLVDANVPTFVYGTFSYLVTAKNIETVRRFVCQNHKGKKVLAIDASVGSRDQIGQICIRPRGIRPGLSSNKDLPTVGDISITAVTAASTNSIQRELSSVRLGFVFDLSRTITEVVMRSVKPLAHKYYTI